MDNNDSSANNMVKNATMLSQQKKQGYVNTGVSKEEAPAQIKKENKNIELKDNKSLTEARETKAPPETDTFIEKIPSDIDVSNEEKKFGIQPVTSSIIINGRKINFPIPLEDLDDGRKQPVTSGRRWLSELIYYIIARLHLTIKKVHGVIKVIKS